jgi:hypothetical protein
MDRHARIALAAALTLCVSPAWATTAIKASLTELAQTSTLVVRGTVKRLQSRWDHQRILTDVDIQVTEALKGQPGALVRLTQPGGHVGNLGQTVEGLASFAEGEEVVVFLRPHSSRGYMVAGFSQGKFHVAVGADGKRVAVPERGELVLLDRVTHAPVDERTAPIELSTLRALVRSAPTAPTRAGSP